MKIFLIQLLSMVVTFTAQGQKSDSLKVPEPKSFITNHQGTYHKIAVRYRAEAKEVYLTDDKANPVASIWSVSYLRTDVPDGEPRPVVFVFNGGPGSASIWLHMGFLGPRRVMVDSDANQDDGAPPYPVVANEQCLLDIADLVFIDPVGTGFSKAIGKGKDETFWGLREDARSVAQFIRLWTTGHNRWMSPKYIIGESFGTTRAAAVTAALEQGGQDLALNGLILISQALDYAGSTSVDFNITSYLTYLPSMAATSWYYKKAGVGQPLESFLDKARTFTYQTYAPCLLKGNFLSSKEKEMLADSLAYFTGLDTTYIRQSNYRILVPRFQKELLRDQGKTIGRLDARYWGKEWDQTAAEPTLGDAADYRISSAYTAALNDYLAKDLNVSMDSPYLTGNDAIYNKWDWKPVPKDAAWEPSYVNTAPGLGTAMRRNNGLRVLVASGYFDLITPFFDGEYTCSRNGIPTDRIEFSYYYSGHMIYNHDPDRQKLIETIHQFIQRK